MADISEHRKQIDAIDDQILAALCERVKICKSIGEEKKKQKIPIRDASRENALYRRIKTKAAKLGLDAGQVEAVYREIVNMCSAVQE
jgi:chorismate mutase